MSWLINHWSEIGAIVTGGIAFIAERKRRKEKRQRLAAENWGLMALQDERSRRLGAERTARDLQRIIDESRRLP